jgi:type III secretory pathway component EscS
MLTKDQNLDRQVSLLIQSTPDPETASAVGLIASVLKAIAQNLKHTVYFIVQDINGGWLLTPLSNHDNPELEKITIYAYCDRIPANIDRLKLNDENLECGEYNLIDMLFRLISMKQVDSIVFFDRATDTQHGVEISRIEVEALCEKQIKRAQFGLHKLNEIKNNADIA